VDKRLDYRIYDHDRSFIRVGPSSDEDLMAANEKAHDNFMTPKFPKIWSPSKRPLRKHHVRRMSDTSLTIDPDHFRKILALSF
jgi:hypothetical protein